MSDTSDTDNRFGDLPYDETLDDQGEPFAPTDTDDLLKALREQLGEPES